MTVDPVIDRDTQNVPGAPDIGATILAKIDAAAVFVADVTLVGSTVSGKPTPNPNVLVELGYAVKGLGWSRILLVLNTAFGEPEDLPFDLRQKRAITYSSPEDATERAPERRRLAKTLDSALREILQLPPRSVEAEREATRAERERLELEHLRAARQPRIDWRWTGAGGRNQRAETSSLTLSNIGDCTVRVVQATLTVFARQGDPGQLITMPWEGMAMAAGDHRRVSVDVDLTDIRAATQAAGLPSPKEMFEATFEGLLRVRFRSVPFGEEEEVEMQLERLAPWPPE